MDRLVAFLQSTSFAVLLFLAGLLLFNWPLLSLSSEHGGHSVFSYIFIAWFSLVCCLIGIGRSLHRADSERKR